MPKYIISWNSGYGDSVEEIEAENMDEARAWAYENWKEEAESNARYNAQEWTEDLAEDLL